MLSPFRSRAHRPVLRTRAATRTLLCALTAVALLAPAGRLAGQTWSATAGALAGAAEGAYVGTTIMTVGGRSKRTGIRVLRTTLGLASIPLGAVAGGVMGHRDQDRLRDTMGFGALGFVAGTSLGAALGSVIGHDQQGVWSSVLVGGGVGLLAGSLWGALRHRGSSSSEGDAAASVAFAISAPW